jgi:cell division protein ZapA
VREAGVKKVAEIKIFGHKLLVRSDENEEYIRAIEDYLNTKIEEVRENTKAVSSLDLALLAALNITGEVIKTKEILEKLGRKSEELATRIDRQLA